MRALEASAARGVRTFAHLAQFAGIAAAVTLTRWLPTPAIAAATSALATLVFVSLRSRRRIAIDNVRQALGPGHSDAEVRRIARSSFTSLFLTAMPEAAKLRPHLTSADGREWLQRRSPDLAAMFARAKDLHDRTGGCVFVTPHLGNWELLPDIAAAVGIPLAIVARHLENPYLERMLRASRVSTGHLFLARRQALLPLERALRRGHSVGLVADQATIRGVAAPFFGRPAFTTPMPALLAVRERRPIVVVACIRIAPMRFDGYLGEPIWPGDGNERAEVVRLTEALNLAMEGVIRAHPEQYLWMHNRWKRYV